MLTINNTLDGYLKNVEIKGNTIQGTDLADIRSVGDKVEGQDLYEIPLLCVGKNLFDGKLEIGGIDWTTGNIKDFEKDRVRSKNFSIVESNTRYAPIPSTKVTHIFEYDSSFNFIKHTNQVHAYTSSPNCKYVKLLNATTTNVNIEIQLEEGTQATTYEPYKEHQITILSPVQLGKWDKICFDNEKNDWVVKHHLDLIIDGVSNSRYSTIAETPDTTFSTFYNLVNVRILDGINLENDSLSSVFSNVNKTSLSNRKTDGYVNNFCIIKGGDGILRIQFLMPKTITTVSQFNDYLKNNNVLLKYETKNVVTDILPHSQQVKLRTFAPKTNISSLCEIAPTIKGDVAKSLGGVVNVHTQEIDNIHQELERVKKLEESTVSTVTNDGKDFVSVQSTNQGYFEDVEVKGRTLVNKFTNFKKDYQLNSVVSQNNKGITLTATNSATHSWFKADGLEVGKIYTLSLLVKTSTIDNNLFIDQGDNKEIARITNGVVGVLCKTFKYEGGLIRFKGSNNSNGVVGVDDIVILEGNHIQNPPSYFEGLKSVGDGTDEIVVSSVNENLFDNVIKLGYINGDGLSFNDTMKNYVRSINYIEVPGNSYCCISDKKSILSSYRIFMYTHDMKLIKFVDTQLFETPSNCRYVKLMGRKSNQSDLSDVEFNDILFILNKGTTPKPYIEHKTDKKRLLRLNPTTQTWEKPILREWDYVEKRDGKYRNIEGSGQVVLDGSVDEAWGRSTTNDTETHTQFNLPFTNLVDNSCICDKLNVNAKASHVFSEDCITTSSKYNVIVIRIDKSKLTTQDVAGFKTWLQANNVTVTYQTATTKEYECTNIDLITYPNETNLTVKSGVLVPNISAKYHGTISNIVQLLQKKVSVLESNITGYMIKQNRLQLSSTYSADRVTFRVDTVAASESKSAQEVDNDLFDLMLNNILVGIDNYNRTDMEAMMDFYVSVRKIDYDMWDILWLEIEKQHNPPVEETPVM